MDPESGAASETLFTFNCSDWEDPYQPLMYEFLASLGSGVQSIVSIGYQELVQVALPVGEAEANYTLNVTAVIRNFGGVFVKQFLSVQVFYLVVEE